MKYISLPDISKKEMLLRIIFFATVFIILCIVTFLLYVIVYERCYSVIYPDNMTVFRIIEKDGDYFAVFFNKTYALSQLF